MSESLPALRAEVGALGFGAVLVALGLAALVFALTRRRAGDARLLLFFAPFALLYGVRLAGSTDLVRQAFPWPTVWQYVNAYCTYLLPVSLLAFFEELHGAGWHRSLVVTRWIWTLYAAGAIVYDAVIGPRAAMPSNSPMVVLMIVVLTFNTLRPGKLSGPGLRLIRASGVTVAVLALFVNLASMGITSFRPPEELGFAFLVVTLGMLAAGRWSSGERRLLALNSELETAQRIQTSLLPRALPAIADGPEAPFALAARSRPATAVGGDLYDWSERTEENTTRLELLVADVAGHGVPAALLAAMVKMALSVESTAERAPEEVLSALNATLHGKFERSFVTVAFLELEWNGETATVRFANGGHPAPLLLPADGSAVRELAAEGPVLGRFRAARFLGGATNLAAGDRVLVYSDGLVEAPGPSGEPFGEARLTTALSAHRGDSAADFADRLLAEVGAWFAGAPKEAAEREDDVTLVVLDRLAAPRA